MKTKLMTAVAGLALVAGMGSAMASGYCKPYVSTMLSDYSAVQSTPTTPDTDAVINKYNAAVSNYDGARVGAHNACLAEGNIAHFASNDKGFIAPIQPPTK